MSIRLADYVRRMRRSRRGSVAIQMGLMLTALIGMVALGTEITFLIYKQRQMQSVADSAALGGATALATGYPADLTLEARAITGSLGFVAGTDGVSLAVNNPPLSGPHAGDAQAVEVIVSQPQTLAMVTLFRSGLFNVGARAVATAGSGSSGTFCVLQNNTNSTTGVTISSGARVTLDQCGVAANSTGHPSLLVTSGATLNTLSLTAGGTVSAQYGGTINSTQPVKINQPVVIDPYAAVTMPTIPSACLQTNYTVPTSVHSLPAGLYCGNLTIGSNRTVTMNGTYWIAGTASNRKAFNIQNNAIVTTGGAGVTIILTARSGSNYEQVTVSNSAHVTLTAPTTGPLAGLVFFGDRNAPRSTTSRFQGDSTVNVTGAIYLPSQTAQFLNSAENGSDCTQLIAATILIDATTGWGFRNDCAGTGIQPIGGGTSQTGLVE